MLEQCKNLKFISVIATGYNTVDFVAAKELGIPVSNVPSYGTEGIGQHAFALLMEITNHVGYHDTEVRKGRKAGPEDWCFWDYPSIELENKTMGIVGAGRIGVTTEKNNTSSGLSDKVCDLNLIMRGGKKKTPEIPPNKPKLKNRLQSKWSVLLRKW